MLKLDKIKDVAIRIKLTVVYVLAMSYTDSKASKKLPPIFIS